MKQIVILSGKGGTGKTTVAAAVAHLASKEAEITIVDADVDAANLELLLSPEKLETHEFVGGKVAAIDQELCTDCGICVEVCRFEAVRRDIHSLHVDPIGCEGCGACFYRCPSQAIQMNDQVSGLWFRSNTRFGPLFHAHLYPAAENSGKLVTELKRQARELAKAESRDYLIIDGPPGIGCPVIASCSGSDLALLVTEPTVAGVHDLQRILGTVRHFTVPAAVAINKCDLNSARRQEIEAFCDAEGIPIVARIPFDTDVTKAMVHGRVVTEGPSGELSAELERIWNYLR
ncbi:MAG: ATP-binding protein [Chloroflexota bacterium]|jgi:MinD superfamily P-loop ATPase